MKRVNVACAVSISVLFAVALIFSSTTTHGQALKGEVKLGALIPLSGFASGFGQPQQIAMEMAVEDINKSGGILGSKLNMLLYDDESKGEKSILGFRKFATQDNALAVVGPFLSTQCEVAFPLANRFKTIAISASAGKSGLAEGNRPYAFVNFTTDQDTMPPAVKYWQKKHNIKTVAIVTDIKDALNKSTGTIVMPKLLQDAGIKIIGTSEFVTGEMDFSAQVTKFKGLNPDGIVLSCTIADAAGFAKEARKQGLKTPFIGGVSIQSTKFIELAGADAEGTVTAVSFWVDNQDPQVVSFVREYRKRHGGRDPIPQAAAMYETIMMLKQVIEKNGVTNKKSDLAADRDKIQKGLAALKDFKGLTGNLTMSPGGTVSKEAYVIAVKDGKFVITQ
jgi:branched-chain amino acid transport system substrate-binding protein